MLAKNQLYDARIEGYNGQGQGVCRIDGRAVFVRGGVRGDVCSVRILKSSDRLAWAKVETMYEPSPHRVTPDCPVYPHCGGCHCRHMSYQEELYMKRLHVEQTLARIGGVVLTAGEVIPAPPSRNGWRNKALLPVARVDGRPVTGFFRERSRQVIPTITCPAAAAQVDSCAAATREYMEETGVAEYNPDTGGGLIRHLFVRHTANGTQAALVINGRKLPQSQIWVEKVTEKCPDVKGILTIENQSRGNTVLGDGPVTVLWGAETLTETLGSYNFELHPLAFAQVNSSQAEKLYDRALEYAATVEGDRVVDLYCGVGTLTLWLAGSGADVTGVEVSPWSVSSAKGNAARNGIGNVKFLAGDAGTVAKELSETSIVTVDPPRAGLDEAAVSAIAALMPERLVYISCDPATLARDIKRFSEYGYTSSKLTVVDMFPGTRHVECVVLLTKVEKRCENNLS